MDEARAILDQLMGKTRNFTEDQKGSIQEIHFYDDKVCKNYICGLCPYIAFAGTKSDMGKCPYPVCGDIDADTCRNEWNRLTQEEKDKYGYERKTLINLENIVKQCDKKIDRQKQRAELDMEISEEDLKRVAVIHKQLSEFIERCEIAAEKGDIDDAMAMAKQIEQLKEAARKIVNPPEEKKITVCEVSGNFMSSRDNDERMRAHFVGKQFLGWKMVRDKYAELMAQNPPEASGPPPHHRTTGERGSRDMGRSGGGSGRRLDDRGGRDRSRERSADRNRDKDRNRDRGRGYGNASGGKDRERSREKDRRRQVPDRNASRSRSRDRGGGRRQTERSAERDGSGRGHYGSRRERSQSNGGNGNITNLRYDRKNSTGPPDGSGVDGNSVTVLAEVDLDSAFLERREIESMGMNKAGSGSAPDRNGDTSRGVEALSDEDVEENGFFVKYKKKSSSERHRDGEKGKRIHRSRSRSGRGRSSSIGSADSEARKRQRRSGSATGKDREGDQGERRAGRRGRGGDYHPDSRVRSPHEGGGQRSGRSPVTRGGMVQLTKGWQIVTDDTTTAYAPVAGTTAGVHTSPKPHPAVMRLAPYAADDMEEGEELE